METRKRIIDILTQVAFVGCCIFLCWFTFKALQYTARIFFYDQFIAPTESMMPTLIPGDRIIVDKTLFGARIYSDFNFNPEGGELASWRTRGRRKIRPNDVVVFNFPQHGGKINFVINHVYAKRCIAVPGDTLCIKDGFYQNSNSEEAVGHLRSQELFAQMPDSFFRNGTLSAFPYDEHLSWTIKNMGPLYMPRKGDVVEITPKEGVVYKKIIEWETGKEVSVDWDNSVVRCGGDSLKHYTFAHNFYFMGGDNVANSNDSRYWGLVPEEYIIGVATRISYSQDKQTGKKRKWRRWKKIL